MLLKKLCSMIGLFLVVVNNTNPMMRRTARVLGAAACGHVDEVWQRSVFCNKENVIKLLKKPDENNNSRVPWGWGVAAVAIGVGSYEHYQYHQREREFEERCMAMKTLSMRLCYGHKEEFDLAARFMMDNNIHPGSFLGLKTPKAFYLAVMYHNVNFLSYLLSFKEIAREYYGLSIDIDSDKNALQYAFEDKNPIMAKLLLSKGIWHIPKNYWNKLSEDVRVEFDFYVKNGSLIFI